MISAKNIKIQILNLKNEVKINIFNFNLIFFYEILDQENIDLFYSTSSYEDLTGDDDDTELIEL